MDSTDTLVASDRAHVLGTYARWPVSFVRGEGVYLWDAAGRRYLDFGSGIGVNALGHAHPSVTAAVAEQCGRLMHVGNTFVTVPMVALAQRLCAHSFAEKVFFCNSGTEAVEAALKFARKWARARSPERAGFLAFERGFHGRSMGALSVSSKLEYRAPFEPLPGPVRFARLNDLASVAAQLDEGIAAVIVEPVQGEGGIHVAAPAFLRALRALCKERGVLLIVDEVQCGLGRTGALWAHQQADVAPDIMTLAKPLGGGLPIGATLVSAEVAACISAGDHGSTFGANPVACAAGVAVFDHLSQPSFLARVRERGQALRAGLEALRARHPHRVGEVRGEGLMLGLELAGKSSTVIEAALARGLVLLASGEHVLRFLPPLVVDGAQIDECLAILAQAIEA